MAARRVSLPSADELFRPTKETDAERVEAPAATPRQGRRGEEGSGERSADTAPELLEAAEKRPSGRVRHDEKMTVYVTSEELIDLENARLTLRREHGLAVDRGRVVREALAVVLADLAAKGEQSILVRRLRER